MLKKIRRENSHLTWVEIDLKAIRYNLRELRKLTKKNKFILPNRFVEKEVSFKAQYLLSVVKADAYGHGVKEISKLLDNSGVGFFGVSDIKEGIELRKLGIKKPVLIFESTLPVFAQDIIDYNLMPTICTLKFAKLLNNYAKKVKKRIDIHILIDSGMGRLGVWHEHAFDFVKEIFKLKSLRVMGLFTHFPAADTDRGFTEKQINYIYSLIRNLDKAGMVVPFIHAANSMGLAGYKTNIFNLARSGLILYGLYPHESLKAQIQLKPVMSVKSKIIFLKEVEKGRSISYGRTFFTRKKMKIATIPIGYNDGYFRIFSNKAHVLVKGIKCPVVGRVTMDQTMIDVSKVENIKINDTVVVLGKQKDAVVSADELASYANTINYEIVCSFGNRLPRAFLGDNI